MTKSLQLGRMAVWRAAMLALSGVLALGVAAQKPEKNPNRPPQRQQTAPAARNNAAAPRPNANNSNGNRPPASTFESGRPSRFNNRPSENTPGARLQPRQQIGVGAPRPFVDRMRG